MRQQPGWVKSYWRTEEGEPCEPEDERRSYLVTQHGYQMPRLFVEEVAQLEQYLREHPNWAQEN